MDKIIHCCWFGGPKSKLAQKCRASWEKFAPDWQICEFELPSTLPKFVEAAAADRNWAQVSDWARMRALYDEGGLYFDYDVEMVRPFAPPAGEWVASERTILGSAWMNPGSGIALEKGSPIARYMLEAYERLEYDRKREMMVWINDRLAEAMATSGNAIRVLAPTIMASVDIRGKVQLSADTLTVHHYALSWGGPKRKILQWLSRHGFRWLVDLAVKAKRRIS